MKRFQDILVCVDTRAKQHWALQWAAAMARHTGAKLHLVDVLREFSWYAQRAMPDHDHVRRLLIDEKREKLSALADSLQSEGIKVGVKVLSGHTSIEVIREVLRNKHDLVIRTAKGTQSRRSGFVGTTSSRLMRKCPCPVWIVKPDAPPSFQHVLAAVEPAPEDDEHVNLSNQILELGKSICQFEQGKLSVLHVWEMFGEDVLLTRMSAEEVQQIEQEMKVSVEASFDRLLSPHGMSIRDENVHLIQGEVSAAIVRFVEQYDVDLLVMGTVARSGISGLLMGNTAEIILNRIACPVLALKPPGFVSPIRV